MDEDLRALERAAKESGEPRDLGRLWRAEVRAGRRSLAALEVGARFGHPAALVAVEPEAMEIVSPSAEWGAVLHWLEVAERPRAATPIALALASAISQHLMSAWPFAGLTSRLVADAACALDLVEDGDLREWLFVRRSGLDEAIRRIDESTRHPPALRDLCLGALRSAFDSAEVRAIVLVDPNRGAGTLRAAERWALLNDPLARARLSSSQQAAGLAISQGLRFLACGAGEAWLLAALAAAVLDLPLPEVPHAWSGRPRL